MRFINMIFAEMLRHIDYDSLCISDYSRNYIKRMLPVMDYYTDIYNRCLDDMLRRVGKPASEVCIVDYGGGHGFFSILAKQRGVGSVVYIDYNPKASETVSAVANKVGIGPDIVLTGDSATLRDWCKCNCVSPDALMGMDVIEHIYRLDSFFADVYDMNPKIRMLFTTGSTPYNPIVVHRLHRFMEMDEYGDGDFVGFLELRCKYIVKKFPSMDDRTLDRWAKCTRGLKYSDIEAAVSNGSPFDVGDAYNTCDPVTGSWTERILPIRTYRNYAKCHGALVKVDKGFYNAHRNGIKGLLSQGLNALLHLPGTLFIAPFIILNFEKE